MKMLHEDATQLHASQRTMRQVHARVAEANASSCGRQRHRLLRLRVLAVFHRPHKVLSTDAQSVQRPHVRNRVRALIRRPATHTTTLAVHIHLASGGRAVAQCSTHRKFGLVGRGVRMLYGIAVNDSSEWHRTSKPEAAATSGGMVAMFSGSTMPSNGRSMRLAMPVLAWACKTQCCEPVPSWGRRGPATQRHGRQGVGVRCTAHLQRRVVEDGDARGLTSRPRRGRHRKERLQWAGYRQT